MPTEPGPERDDDDGGRLVRSTAILTTIGVALWAAIVAVVVSLCT